jgi:Family of unknown function (DUF6150)
MPKVFLVKHSYEADRKVYFVDHAYEADEKIYIVAHGYEADYKAYEVNHAYEADTKVFRVKHAYEADPFKRSSRIPKSSGFFSSSRSSGSSYTGSSVALAVIHHQVLMIQITAILQVIVAVERKHSIGLSSLFLLVGD